MHQLIDLIKVKQKNMEDRIKTQEYIDYLFFLIDRSNSKDFLETYETYSEFICPKSALEIPLKGEDQTKVIYSVCIIKKQKDEVLESFRKFK